MKKIALMLAIWGILCFMAKAEIPIKKGIWKTKTINSMLRSETDSVEYHANQLMIKFKPATTADEINEFLNKFNLTEVNFVNGVNWHIFYTEEDPLVKLAKIEKENPGILESANPDFILKQCFEPNDSLYVAGKQWHFINSRIAEALDNFPAGENEVIIGFIDSGIDYWFLDGDTLTHEDLPNVTSKRIIIGKDFSDENENGFFAIQDKSGHGTFVYGEVDAITNNIKGVASPLSGYKIKSLINQLFNQNGSATLSKAVESIIDLVDNGVNIINLSGGGPAYSFAMEDAIAYAQAFGVKVVCAAGNESWWGLIYPARLARIGTHPEHWTGYTNVISVGYTDVNNKRATWSSIGPELICVAPGEKIASATPIGPFKLESYGWTRKYYVGGSGSSFSAPLVTTLIAMMIAYNPNLTDEQILEAIVNTSQKIGGVEYRDDGRGLFNPEYGYGLVDFYSALQYVHENYPVIVEKIPARNPQTMKLSQNYPNPFNPKTTISFEIKEKGLVGLNIYNTLGQKVLKLTDEYRNAGNYKINVDMASLSSGIYFYKLEMIANKKKYSLTKKMLLIK